jgi:hypothetical protein
MFSKILDIIHLIIYNNDMGKKWSKSKLDFQQLVIEIRAMTPQTTLYKILRNELTKLSHWKQRPRGNPIKAYNSRGKKHE